MDAKRILKKYIQRTWMRNLGLILVLGCLAGLVAAAVAGGNADDTAAEFFPSESPVGTMAYIDVAGVSDWLLDTGDKVYYTVMDAEEYFYTAVLTDKQFKAMQEQYDYFLSEEVLTDPPTVRIEGLVVKTDSEVRSSLAEVWGISTAQYDNSFGTLLLDTTTSASNQAAAPGLVIALLCGCVALAFLVLYFSSSSTAKKSLQKLEADGLLEEAARQLQNVDANRIIGKNRGMLSRDFLFGKGTGAAVAVKDLLWVYQQNRKRNFVPVNSYLMAGTRHTRCVGAIDLNCNDRLGVIEETIEELSRRNPQLLVGYTKENSKQFNELCKNP